MPVTGVRSQASQESAAATSLEVAATFIRRSIAVTRKEIVIAGVLALVVLFAGLSAVNPYPLGVLHDDAVYAILAKSLATGQGYRYLNLPGAPAATHFPPGYPLFLAALWKLAPNFPGNVALFKLANVGLLVAGYGALGLLLRRRYGLSIWGAWGVALLATASVPMLLVSTLVLSETLFFAVATVALLATERVIARPSSGIGASIVAGALCGAASLVRTPGIALVGGALLVLGWQRRVREAVIVGGVSIALLLPWQVWTALHQADVPLPLRGAYGSYSAWIGDAVREHGGSLLARTVAMTSGQAADVIMIAISPWSSTILRALAAVGLLLLVVFGIRAALLGRLVLPLFLAIYAVLILVWPSPPARYIWGMWPLALVLPVLGGRSLWLSFRELRWPRLAVAAFALVPIVGYAKYTIDGFRHRVWLRIPEQGGAMLRPLVTGVRDHVAPIAVVATPAEAAVYLYAGRLTVPTYSFTATELFRGPELDVQAPAFAEIVSTYSPDAILVATALQDSVVRRLNAASPVKYVAADSTPGGIVFRRASPPTE